MDVAATGLVKIVAARGGDISDGGSHGHVDAHGLRVGVNTRADDNALGASAHEVQGGGVIRHAARDHRGIDGGDELLEVERLPALLDVLGGNERALDKQDLRARLDDDWGELTGTLRGHAHSHGHTGIANLRDALGEQFLVERSCVEFLQRREIGGVLGRTSERAFEILVASPQAFGVNNA